MKKLLLIPLMFTLAACASAGPKVFVAPEQLDRAKFVAPEVAPAEQMNIEWTIITKDNVNENTVAPTTSAEIILVNILIG